MTPHTGTRRVLVVDDELQARERLYDVLTGKGYQVLTSGTGEQALELLKAQRPQLVVLDVGLPGMSGIETAQRIRAFDEAMPVVLWRGSAESAPPAEELKRLGIGEVVEKEWEDPKILERLEQSLNASTKAAPGDTGISGNLLVIDDDTQVQMLLKMFFESKGLRVYTASSGEEGLKELSRNPVLVLLDINMPGMDGVLTLKKIKAANPSVPVVMISGGGEEGMAKTALQSGAYDYISKPFNMNYLETVVLTKVLLGLGK